MIIDARVRKRFPDLNILTTSIQNITVKKESKNLEEFKSEFISKIRSRHNVETLKDVPELRCYRDFFWEIGIDPTKTRPASEALIRRVIQGKPLPRINTLVDSYNLASMESRVPLAAFDQDVIADNVVLRVAQAGERFTGIGMKKPVTLEGNELVMESGESLIAVYPYRDAESSKIRLSTKNVLIVVCGVPGVSGAALENAKTIAVQYITRFCK